MSLEWSDVAETVAKIAPAAGGAMGGPAGAAVGSLLARVLGVDESPEAVRQAVQQDPEAALKLREVEARIETSLIEGRAGVVKAEAGGESWLQRNWRPLLMLWFAVLLGGHWFGFTPETLTEDTVLSLFSIVKLGVTGYITSRGVEKVTRTLTDKGATQHFMDAIKRK